MSTAREQLEATRAEQDHLTNEQARINQENRAKWAAMDRDKRQPGESLHSYRERRWNEWEAQNRSCRDEQNRNNALTGQSARQADANARATLARLRRRPNEIDPEGRL